MNPDTLAVGFGLLALVFFLLFIFFAWRVSYYRGLAEGERKLVAALSRREKTDGIADWDWPNGSKESQATKRTPS